MVAPFNRVVIGTQPDARTVSASEFLELRPEERVEHVLHGQVAFFSGEVEVSRSHALRWLRTRPCQPHRDVIDHRRHARVPLDVNVIFSPSRSHETFAGIARDISLGGVFVTSRQVLPIGAELLLRVTLPCQIEELTLSGVVRWQRPDGMGIELREVGERETRAIIKLVAARGP